jgi:arylsulfatase A-like enzyme
MPPLPRGDWVDSCLTTYRNSHRADPQVGTLSPAALQRARAGYYGHMGHIDHQINRFVETLAEFGLRDSTYFCFVSDHGEMLGDHDCFRKSLPYDGSARIPLLLWGPSGSGIRQGIRVGAEQGAVAELRDILPTLLDCAGLPAPEGIDGRSLLPWTRGETPPDWRPHLHGEHLVFGQSLHWLTDGRDKYVWWSGTGREQLFDLAADPQECHDLAADRSRAAHLARWRALLIETLTDREEGFVKEGALVIGRPVRPILAHTANDSQ